jgi:hypothetical protein
MDFTVSGVIYVCACVRRLAVVGCALPGVDVPKPGL